LVPVVLVKLLLVETLTLEVFLHFLQLYLLVAVMERHYLIMVEPVVLVVVVLKVEARQLPEEQGTHLAQPHLKEIMAVEMEAILRSDCHLAEVVVLVLLEELHQALQSAEMVEQVQQVLFRVHQ
jgi:hypothetical protein